MVVLLTWGGVDASNTTDCGYVPNGKLSLDCSRAPGAVCDVTCDTGFYKAVDGNLTCLSGAHWSSDVNTICLVAKCSDYSPNGVFTSHCDMRTGSRCKYYCGSSDTDGIGYLITCLPSRQWDLDLSTLCPVVRNVPQKDYYDTEYHQPMGPEDDGIGTTAKVILGMLLFFGFAAVVKYHRVLNLDNCLSCCESCCGSCCESCCDGCCEGGSESESPPRSRQPSHPSPFPSRSGDNFVSMESIRDYNESVSYTPTGSQSDLNRPEDNEDYPATRSPLLPSAPPPTRGAASVFLPPEPSSSLVVAVYIPPDFPPPAYSEALNFPISREADPPRYEDAVENRMVCT
ncbi:hypothetical protein ScPMuIL_004974 [Solemya velum]